MRRYLQVGGIVLAVALVAAAGYLSYASSTRQATAMVGIVARAGGASLDVVDQLGARGTLAVRRVQAPDASWVAVYVMGMGGMPGGLAGLAHVSAGESTDVAVTLDPDVELTEKVVVVLQADRGVHGTFEFDPSHFEVSPDKPYFVGGKEVETTVTVRFNEMENAVPTP